MILVQGLSWDYCEATSRGCWSHLKAWLGLKDTASIKKADSYGCRPEASAPHHTGFSTELSEDPQNMAAVPPRANDPRENECGQNGNCSISYFLISEMIYHHSAIFCWIQSSTTAHCERQLHKGGNIMRQESFGLSSVVRWAPHSHTENLVGITRCFQARGM